MRKIYLLACTALIFISSCKQTNNDTSMEEKEINLFLNHYHSAAASANYKDYFDCFSEQSSFMGTDATEKWNKQEFMAWAKPYFDRGKAWSFKPIKRAIYFAPDQPIAWFDELLETKMKICRGSGVLAKEKNGWKLKQYVLSMTVPNTKTTEVVALKDSLEQKVLEQIVGKK